MQVRVPITLAGSRLDQALAELLPEFSRARLQHWIRSGLVQVDARSLRPRDKLRGGELVVVCPESETDRVWRPEAMPLRVVFEDDWLLVVDKPAGLVVHPAAGNLDGTLVNALLYHAPELAGVPRAGVVHRLDKDTTGLLVVARNLPAHAFLAKQLAARRFLREYRAVVHGVLPAGGSVDAPLGRHPVDRKRMAVGAGGRTAVTHYRVERRFRAHTLLRLRLETGRTHQIRVHMAHIRHPLVGDPVYGGRPRRPPQPTTALIDALAGFRRQALHAARLGLTHPYTRETLVWEAPLPADVAALLAALAADADAHGPAG